MGRAADGGTRTAEALLQAGIEVVFGLPGGHIRPLFQGADRAGLPLYAARHEENAALMAAGWALATGRPAAVAVTAGPGLTNALPGMAEAQASGVPMVVVAGRTALSRRHRGTVQDLDQMSLVASVVKWRAEVSRAAELPGVIAEAVHRSRRGAPGVSYVEVPEDVFDATDEAVEMPWRRGFPDPSRSVPATDAVAAAVSLLTGAERPVILVGSGAFFSGAGPALAAFADRTGIPVVTTAAARGLLPDSHPRSLGSLVHGALALVSADASLVLGSRFNANLTYGGPPLFGADQQVVQVDVAPENLGGNRLPDLALTGDVAATLDALAAAWTAPGDRFDGWLAQARETVAASRGLWEGEAGQDARPFHPGGLARAVADFAAARRATFVVDGGDAVVWGLAFGRAERPGSALCIGSALGTLGGGLPFALGARVAHGDRPVVLYTGDGAFGMSAMEIDTAARYHLPVVVVVADNGCWRESSMDTAAGDGPQQMPVSQMRYDLLARAVGGYGVRVEAPEELVPALEQAAESAAASGLPAVVDAVVDTGAMSTFMKGIKGLDLM